MKYYWKTKTGEKIDVDEMDVNHLRNVLKMIMRNNAKKDVSFSESEMENIFRDRDDDWLWK